MEICFQSLILPANQAGGEQKEKMDNVGLNLCFIVVVVVIVWGIILGNMCERESLLNVSFSDMRTVSHDDNSDDQQCTVRYYRNPTSQGSVLYRSNHRNREHQNCRDSWCIEPSNNSTGLALPQATTGQLSFQGVIKQKRFWKYLGIQTAASCCAKQVTSHSGFWKIPPLQFPLCLFHYSVLSFLSLTLFQYLGFPMCSHLRTVNTVA